VVAIPRFAQRVLRGKKSFKLTVCRQHNDYSGTDVKCELYNYCRYNTIKQILPIILKKVVESSPEKLHFIGQTEPVYSLFNSQ